MANGKHTLRHTHTLEVVVLSIGLVIKKFPFDASEKYSCVMFLKKDYSFSRL